MIAAEHPFTPEQLREHRRLEKAGRRLVGRLARTITPRALAGTLDALERGGHEEILRGDGAIVLADCCLFEWPGEGRTLVRRYAESAEARRLTADERRVLELWQPARLTLLRVDEVWPDHGMRVHDALEGRDLVLLAPDLSRPLIDGFWLIARVFPAGDCWMTTPCVTLMGRLGDWVLEKMRKWVFPMHEKGDPRVPLVLATLALGVHETLAGLEEEGRGEEEPGPEPDLDGLELIEAVYGDDPPPPTPPGRNDPCPCGSGKKYKKCCALAPRQEAQR